MFTDIITALAVLVLVFMLLLLFRNERVFKYRMGVLSKVSEKAKLDIINNRTDWRRHYNIFERVKYNEMLLKFWRSFDSFFPEEYRP